jgi:hypothetical protein
MAITGKSIERPGGARNVRTWELNLVRRLPRFPGDLYDPEFTVELHVAFDDEESAEEFERTIRALLPGVKP